MKILLIDAIDSRSALQLSLPHLGLGYLASFLQENISPPPEIKIVNRCLDKCVTEFMPDIVGISAVTENFNTAKKIAAFCKERDIWVIVGGHHISSIPASLDANMDIGVIGEGEQTFLELVQLHKRHKIKPDELEQVDGIVFRHGDNLRITRKRALIEPLDKLPLPKRDLFVISKKDVIHLFTSRGCPYRCIFCSSSRFWGRVRFFSAEYTLREIEEVLDRYSPAVITFSDDLFIADKKRLRKLTALIRQRNINKQVTFTCKARANLVDDEVAEMLREMNVTEMGMGLESGCQETLSYLKETVTVEDNKRAVQILKRHGILLNPTFIIGAPFETKKQINKTFEFIKESRIDQFNVFTLTPLPGTPLWDYALERGIVANDMDWSKLALNPGLSDRNSINLSEYLTQDDIRSLLVRFEAERKKRYYRNLFRKGLRRPQQILPFVKRKTSLFLKSRTVSNL